MLYFYICVLAAMKHFPCLQILFAAYFVSAVVSPSAFAQHQTATVSSIVVNGSLSYELEITEVDFGAADRPTLHSFAMGEHNGLWVLIAGRTNGLHGMNLGGLANFPEASQNRDVWVIDLVNKLSWHRSLSDAASGLSVAEVDSLTPTNNQFYQLGNVLYMTGGYGFNRDTNQFKTYDYLTAIDLPGIIAWAQGGTGTAATHIRQNQNTLFQVTGGAMYAMGGRMHLVMGQNFFGGYNVGRTGNYTKQVRSFDIVDNGTTLSVANIVQTTPNDAYRRRDLNVVPRIKKNSSTNALEEALVALSGVFTPLNGGWTVPVEIDSNGTPTMADPSLPGTFKQGMHNYHSAKIGLYSEADDSMHTLSFGSISLQYYDRANETFITDGQFPFINQVTSVVIDASGNYTQYLMDEEFPVITDGTGNRLRFGANAEFLPAQGIATYANGVQKLDTINSPTVIGYILGGIVADAGNSGNTAASGRIFQVVLKPASDLLADFDDDGDVDGSDFLTWQQGYGTTSGATSEQGDTNGDGAVDGADFLVWQSEFGNSPASVVASVAIPAQLSALATTTASIGTVLKEKALEEKKTAEKEKVAKERPVFRTKPRNQFQPVKKPANLKEKSANKTTKAKSSSDIKTVTKPLTKKE